VLVCTLGDLVLDVIVQPRAPMVIGDDVPAATRVGAGGQAANVAAWAAALGGRARFVGRRGDDAPGRLVEAELAAHGVELAGPASGRTGIIVSIVGDDRDRSMASDRGSATQLSADELVPEWFTACDWLHVSGYMLDAELGAATAATASLLAHAARGKVSLDIASRTVVEGVGADVFQARAAALRPEVIFGTEPEHAALDGFPTNVVRVIKRGADGCRITGDGQELELAAIPVTAVEATGAGDAFAAGYLMGGPRLAVAAGARCVSKTGAMP
jgi:ribokinase